MLMMEKFRQTDLETLRSIGAQWPIGDRRKKIVDFFTFYDFLSVKNLMR
jgi:hypothetical protein